MYFVCILFFLLYNVLCTANRNEDCQDAIFHSLYLAVTELRGLNPRQCRGAIYCKVKLDT